MAGLDSVLATTLARRLDTLLGVGVSSTTAPNAVAGSQPTGDATSALGDLATKTSPTAVALGNATSQTAARVPTPVQQATLSAAARTIDTILRLAPDSPGPVQASAPVWPAAPGTGAPALAPLVAAALKEALSASGLFYESHLSQWASGSRSFEQLQAEPQLRWPASANLAAQLRAAGADATLPGPGPLTRLLGPAGGEAALATGWPTLSPSALAPSLPSATPNPTPGQHGTPPAQGDTSDGGLRASANLPNTATALAHAASVAHTTSSVLPTGHDGGDASLAASGTSANAQQHGAAGAIAAVANTPAESVTLVRQQLDMLVNPQFQWNGMAWPGAPMEWRVEERPGQQAPGEAAAPSTWHTHLRLTLPSLGTIDVTLGLSGQQLQARLLTDSTASTDVLSNEGEDLRHRLAAVGLIASQLSFGALDEAGEVAAQGDTTVPSVSPADVEVAALPVSVTDTPPQTGGEA
ncbi:flagellar hook-length control protein FliK [Pandoraea commovens]|uniref:Flagellar hook-length control protein FliK n=1 Tax=Pandoraea commovens TaxID=2508289 RepID=A0ABY5QF47_9BURK|nr:flagellar hook-length control protein FliK [Pandoraea commovens]UVA79431.1 flagellar hook-length control protein FliK [Pandoraea commovens]